MIYIYYGRPGSGKSASAVLDAWKWAKEGRTVLANFHPAGHDLWQYALWAEMVEATNAVCIVDEAQLWFSSRSWQKQTTEDLGVFQQSRKAGLDLVIICQHYDRLDVAIRELAHWYVKHNRVGRLVLQRYHTHEEKKRYVRTKLHLLNPQAVGLYFTTEILGNREGHGQRVGRTDEYGPLLVRATLRTHTTVRPASHGPALAAGGWATEYGYLRAGMWMRLPEDLAAGLRRTPGAPGDTPAPGE